MPDANAVARVLHRLAATYYTGELYTLSHHPEAPRWRGGVHCAAEVLRELGIPPTGTTGGIQVQAEKAARRDYRLGVARICRLGHRYDPRQGDCEQCAKLQAGRWR